VFKNGALIDATGSNPNADNEFSIPMKERSLYRRGFPPRPWVQPGLCGNDARHFVRRKIARLVSIAREEQAYEEADNGNRKPVNWILVCIQRPGHGRWREIYFDDKLIGKTALLVLERIEAADESGKFSVLRNVDRQSAD